MKKFYFLLTVFLISLLSCVGVYAAEDETETEITPSIEYTAHVQDLGWLNPVTDGQLGGTEGQAKNLEALKVNVKNLPANDYFEMRGHSANVGWGTPVYNEGEIGVTGKNWPLEAVSFNINNNNGSPSGYDIYYCAHIANIGWLDWAKNGETAGTTGLGLPLEAVKIIILPSGSPAPGETKTPAFSVNDFNNTSITYALANPLYGLFPASNGNLAGIEGQGVPMYYMSANLNNNLIPGSSVAYQAYSSNVGWCGYVRDNAPSGVEGCQIEAFQMVLEGPIANLFDIYYRGYVGNVGWQDWAKNGELAGSAEGNCPLQAINVQLVRIGEQAPGSTFRAFLPVPRGMYFNGYGILVSIPLQMVFIQNANNQMIFFADCVTGYPNNPEYLTPTGNFSILGKSRNTYLYGADYVSHVDYWIPFIGHTWGFHDADWRQDNEFGKGTYLIDPSHGCINMRDPDIALFNQLIRIGDPVIIR